MKKTKILTVLGVLLAMGITACGGKTTSKSASGAAGGSSGGGASTSQPSQTTSRPATHQHNWVEDTSAYVAPGCETEGQKTYRCTGEGTCPQNNVKTEKVAALGHDWGTAIPVAASNGGVSYNKYECQRNNKADKAVKYDIDLTGENRITLVGSSALKADNNVPGYVKLNSPNGGSFTIDFYSDAYGVGKIYQNGVMDHMSGSDTANQSKSFFSGNSTSSTHADEIGNFELKVNDVAVDFSDKTKTFGDMFPAVDADHPAVADTYSPLAEIETGAVTVGKGLNQISFKRVDSYNIILKSFVIVFVPQEHAEHTFPTEWTVEKAETCTTDGLESRKCSVCGIKEERVVKAAHKWGAATPVAADTDKGYMAYNKYECSACHKIKYEFAAKEAKDAVTNNKTSNPPTPDPYIKLKSNGKTFSIKFNAEKLLDGELYQEGIFDQWPTNGKKFGYFSHTGNVNDSDATKAAAAKAAEETGNFEVSVNGQPIDLSQYKGGGNDSATFNFFGWSGDETSQTFTGDNTAWSKDILCPVGHMSIEKGEAEIVYKRVESYNLAVKNIILVVNEYDHEHTKADTLSSDEEGHWYACSDAQCPLKGIKLEYAKHTLEADTSKTDVEATCSKEGTHYVKCSVCEKELAQKVDKLPHTWVDDESKTDVPATCAAEGKHYVKCSKCDATDEQPIAKSAHNWGEPGTKINGATPYTCTVCSAKCYVLEFTDANSDGIHAAGKFSSGSASWNITGIDAGSYELYAYACTKGTSMGTQFGSRYYWNVDSGAKIEANSGTYEDYGFGTGEGTDYQWTKKSAATITITDTSALFKMSFQSSGYSAYFSALRLVKVA